jgi:LPS export ABC transporter protein LptC
MKANRFAYLYQTITIVITMVMVFSCKNNIKTVNDMYIIANEPSGIGDSISLKYTDSTFLKAHLISPKAYDYGNRNFSFTEFTEGITLHIYDDGEKNTVFADYAISYKDTDLIDLRGNVVIAMATKDTLFTEQLYYMKEESWLFSNNPVTLKSIDYVMKGVGFDSNENFDNAAVLEFTGEFTGDED